MVEHQKDTLEAFTSTAFHLPDLPGLPISSIARMRVAGGQLWQRILSLPIRKQYGVRVFVFNKTGIFITTICPSILRQ